MRGIDHVAIAVHRIDDALPFFTTQAGYPLVQVETLDDPKVRLAYLDAGNVMLQLVEPLGPGRIADFLEERGEGLHHVCLTVDDIGDFLRWRGLDRSAEIFQGGRQRAATFLREQPSGVTIELTEAAPRE